MLGDFFNEEIEYTNSKVNEQVNLRTYCWVISSWYTQYQNSEVIEHVNLLIPGDTFYLGSVLRWAGRRRRRLGEGREGEGRMVSGGHRVDGGRYNTTCSWCWEGSVGDHVTLHGQLTDSQKTCSTPSIDSIKRGESRYAILDTLRAILEWRIPPNLVVDLHCKKSIGREHFEVMLFISCIVNREEPRHTILDMVLTILDD